MMTGKILYQVVPWFCTGLFLLSGWNLNAQNVPELYRKANQPAMNHWVDSIFDSMTVDEKIGQLFMVVTDPKPSSRKRMLKQIREQQIGGILFSKGDLKAYARSINLYQKSSRIPLFISFDGEWGLSMRIDDTPRFPRNMMLGAIADNEWLVRYGEEMGRECRELGVHINFAPVLDVNSNPDNPVIGMRSFGENPQLVAEKGSAYALGLEKMQVLSVGKHFPGHGDTSEDSHNTLPEIRQSRARLDSVELYPFVQYIRNGYAGMMTGHLFVPALDSLSKRATSLSPAVVTRLLTGELGFEGLKFTDALVMKGAVTGNNSVCVESLLAGNDILLSPKQPVIEFAAVKQAVETGLIPMTVIEEKCRKILRYKYICGLNRYKPIVLRGLSDRIHSDYSERLVQKLNEEAVTLLKNEPDALPLQSSERKIAVVSLGDESFDAFRKTMDRGGSFDFFQWKGTEEEYPAELFEKLGEYEVILWAIHSNKIPDYPEIHSLSNGKEVHFCFFIAPYQLCNYAAAIHAAQSVTLAYENTEYAQTAAAKIILGQLPSKGKLPVTIAGLFDYGTGMER
ncbi:MAG: glycoside hydrolase family 3 protein [Dysgonamonadaceae bacterium]|jgi:beta-glucosidase-like glycosyl hydrolase|nr:glycoside hydrolase family 3 protein [Dysgonamonadaceae bacterium]